jgi:hypothetical protein
MSERFFQAPNPDTQKPQTLKGTFAKDFRQENFNNFLKQIKPTKPDINQEIQIRLNKD